MMERKADKEIQGTILEVVRMSTEDGPGLRTTVFFKGCPLHCRWCHNPESISLKPQIQWLGAGCIGCHICIRTCKTGALSRSEKGIVIDRSVCNGCGLCAAECPTTAMDLLGKKWTVHDLAGELVKDRVYFDQSGGGVTLSGGEAALQHEFCLALLKELRSRRIQTALDTCGQVPQAVLESLLPYVDILLYDLKLIDPVQHKAWTGSNNERILANAAFVAAYKKTHRSPKTVWMRTPVIPDATDTEENIRGLGEFIQANLRGCVSRWELCAFNNLCRDKYERMGLDWPFAETPLPERSRMEALAQTAKSAVSASIVCWSGATRLEPDAKGRCTPARENKTISVPGSSKWTKGGLSWPK